jgi:hypothetical protein
LNFEAIARVIHARDGFEQARRHRGFVEERKLNGHEGQLALRRRVEVWSFAPFERSAMAPAQVNQVRSMEPVGTEEQQDGEVDDAERGLHELSR